MKDWRSVLLRKKKEQCQISILVVTSVSVFCTYDRSLTVTNMFLRVFIHFNFIFNHSLKTLTGPIFLKMKNRISLEGVFDLGSQNWAQSPTP